MNPQTFFSGVSKLFLGPHRPRTFHRQGASYRPHTFHRQGASHTHPQKLFQTHQKTEMNKERKHTQRK